MCDIPCKHYNYMSIANHVAESNPAGAKSFLQQKCREMTEHTMYMGAMNAMVRLDREGIHVGEKTWNYSQVIYMTTNTTHYNSLALAFQSITDSGIPHVVFHVLRFDDPLYLGLLSGIIKASVKIGQIERIDEQMNR